MSFDRIPHNALHARFARKKNKGRPRLRWIDNVLKDTEINWTDIEGSNGRDNVSRTMEIIHSYQLPPNGWRQEQMLMMRICRPMYAMYALCMYAYVFMYRRI